MIHQTKARTVIGGVRGLRNVICLSAVLMSLGQVPAIAKVVRVNVQRGEIEVDGTPSRAEIQSALASASELLDQVGAESGEGYCDPHRASDTITVTPFVA